MSVEREPVTGAEQECRLRNEPQQKRVCDVNERRGRTWRTAQGRLWDRNVIHSRSAAI